MTEKWHSITRISCPAPAQVAAEAAADADSPWFSGHFPGNPILPGIAQLGMVRDVVGQVEGPSFRVCELKRVRFKQMIRPDDAITVTARRRGENPTFYSFRIMAKDQLACTGILIASE